eukprot:scaffold20893_cov86-Cyclotella_meneghiniana.AAC.6
MAGELVHDDDIMGDVGTAGICQNMVQATLLTKWEQMCPSIDLLLGLHIHLTAMMAHATHHKYGEDRSVVPIWLPDRSWLLDFKWGTV